MLIALVLVQRINGVDWKLKDKGKQRKTPIILIHEFLNYIVPKIKFECHTKYSNILEVS